MKNIIKHITDDELSYILKNTADNTFIAEIDGRNILTEDDWLYTMAETFRFPVFMDNRNVNWFEGAFLPPRKYMMNWNRFEDWMTDLDWLDTDSVVLIIRNYSHIFGDNTDIRDYVINELRDIILPWWETEVVDCVVEGKPKAFNVFLIG